MSEGPNLLQLLKAVIEHGATALQLTQGAAPSLRLGAQWTPLKSAPLAPADLRALLYPVLTESQKERLETDGALRFAFGVKGLARFFTVAYLQRGVIAVSVRPIPLAVPAMPDWVIPARAWLEPGRFVLVAGRPESGRSAVLAQLVTAVLEARPWHVLTLEEPITWLFPHRNATIDQLELGADLSREEALATVRAASSDAVMVGVDDGLELAAKVFQSGKLTLASVTASSVERALERVRTALTPAERRDVAGIVWLDAPVSGRLLEGSELAALLG